MFQFQQFMTRKDWAYLTFLLVVSIGLWAWVWREYQKPIVDTSWYAGTVSAAGHEYDFE